MKMCWITLVTPYPSLMTSSFVLGTPKFVVHFHSSLSSYGVVKEGGFQNHAYNSLVPAVTEDAPSKSLIDRTDRRRKVNYRWSQTVNMTISYYGIAKGCKSRFTVAYA